MDRFGLGYENLLSVNSSVIVVSMSAAGLTGPLNGVIGYAPTIAALSGLSSLVGYKGLQPLGMTQVPYSDTVAAITSVFATLVALNERQNSGKGQFIEVSQWEALIALLPEMIVSYSMNQEILGPTGDDHRLFCPHGTFPCKGNDSWVSLSIRSDLEWRRLCELITVEPDWNGQADSYRRMQHREEINKSISAWTSNLTAGEVTIELQGRGIPAFPVVNIEGVFSDEHLQYRDAFPFVNHPLVGDEPVPGLPWKFSKTPGRVRTAAPLLGIDNGYVFREVLGITDEEYQALVKQGAIEESPLAEESQS